MRGSSGNELTTLSRTTRAQEKSLTLLSSTRLNYQDSTIKEKYIADSFYELFVNMIRDREFFKRNIITRRYFVCIVSIEESLFISDWSRCKGCLIEILMMLRAELRNFS